MSKSGTVTNKEVYESTAGVKAFKTEGPRGVEDKLFDAYFHTGTILDLGCGAGRTSALLAARGLEVSAMDISEGMILEARKKYPSIRFDVMDAAKLEYPDSSFDYAFFSYNGLDYLHPQTNRLKALHEIHRILKPGGIFAFSSHNLWCLPNSRGRLLRLLRTMLYGKLYPYQWDFQSFGALLTRYISPGAQMRELVSCDFTFLELMSNYANPTLRDPYPTYVCKKP